MKEVGSPKRAPLCSRVDVGGVSFSLFFRFGFVFRCVFGCCLVLFWYWFVTVLLEWFLRRAWGAWCLVRVFRYLCDGFRWGAG